MNDNPFADLKPLTINVDAVDNIFEVNGSKKKEYSLFEVPLLFIYKNENTQTFAEFELDDMGPAITPLEAIDIFMQRVVEFGKADAKALPMELLSSLTDAELDLFLLAGFKEHYYEQIRSMIYIQKEHQYYKDRYGFNYYVAGIGINEAILYFPQNEKLLILHTTLQQIQHQGEKLYVIRDDSVEY